MKTITFGGKTCDCFWMGVKVDEKTHFNYDGYVPSGMCIGGGDEIELEIDIETGTVVGWNKEKVLAKLAELKQETED